VNPAPAHQDFKDLLRLADIIVLNETELQLLTGACVSLESGLNSCEKLRAFPEQIVVLTLGKEGVVALAGSQTIRVPGLPVKAVDTTGAGDCFVGALASRLALGSPLEGALAFANKAAAISVQSIGAATSMPTLTEVEAQEPLK
jgi:ribokinase